MDPKCPHNFGYLSQCPREEEIPGECMTCEKVVECIFSELKSNASALKIKPNIPMVKEVKKFVEESAEKTLKKELIEARASEIKTEPLTTEPLGDRFIVENLGMPYALWSNTLRIHRETLSGWGEKIKEVEIETANGRRTRCRVQPMEDSSEKVIQIPDKMQLNLEIMKGGLVRVKPVIKS